jgi:hypothetical protein
MAARATVNYNCRLAPEVPEAIRRLAAISNRSQPQILQSLILNFEELWLKRFAPDERQRYEACLMSHLEAREIRRRESMKASHDDAPAGPAAHGGQPGAAAQEDAA